MTVQWTVRAANDRARSSRENRARNRGADPCGLLFVFLWSIFTVDCNEVLWTKSNKMTTIIVKMWL